MAWQGMTASPRRDVTDGRVRPHTLVSLAGRLLVAQAGASAAVGLGYNRRNMPWLVVTILVALALCALAGLVRSGSNTTWLVAIGVESALVAVGLFRFAYARYMGGTLLAIITLGMLLHPAVARVFAAAPRLRHPVHDHPALADGPTDVLPGQALG